MKRTKNPQKGATRNGWAAPENIRDMCIIPISLFVKKCNWNGVNRKVFV
jgi:hypothetical protein